MNENFKEERIINLKEIFFVMLHNIWLIILLGIIGYVGMYMYSKLTEIPTYTSSVSLYVKNTTNKTSVDSMSANDLTAAQIIAETYIAILENDVVMESVGNKLLEKYPIEELQKYFVLTTDDEGNPEIEDYSIKDKIVFEQVNETELLQVSVTTPDPILSTDMCTFITECAPEVLIRVVGAGSVETVGQPRIPKYSDGSKVPGMSRSGALAGILLAVIIIYLRYTLDNTINNGEVIKARYDLPMLAEIPFYDVTGSGDQKNKNSTGLLARLKFKLKNNDDNKIERSIRTNIKDIEVPFVVTEAYNTLRTNLIFALSTNKSNVAVVSSSLSGEGKSTSVANLALSIGETEARVLIVDADLRRPTQHKLFKLKNDKGLITVLSGMSKFEDIVNRKVRGNTDVITAGPMPPNPSQMIASEAMANFIAKVSGLYDYVIIDTSPVNIVSDAVVLAKLSAGVILVARQGITTFDQIERAIESIRFTDSNVLGVIVNSVNYDKGIYKKKNYRYRYTYAYDNINKEENADNK